MGLREDNWPAVVGVFSGVLAKEVVVGTLDNLYSSVARQDDGHPAVEQTFDLGQSLMDAAATVPANLVVLSEALLDPLGFGSVSEQDAAAHGVDDAVFGAMHARFDGKVGAFAYLLFILLYFPCVATIGCDPARNRHGLGGVRRHLDDRGGLLHRDRVLPGGDLCGPPAELADLDHRPDPGAGRHDHWPALLGSTGWRRR
jgi:hypothetical protein